MDTFMNFTDELINYGNIKPLMDTIEQVMSIPEEHLTNDAVDIISGMISGAFTPKMREDAINDMIKNFEEQNLSRTQVIELIEQSRKEIENGINELEPSPSKRAILDAIFDFFYETLMSFCTILC